MKKWILIMPVILAFGCGGKHATPKPDQVPAKVELILPAKNSLCTTGPYNHGATDDILFTWNASANTDSYEINLKNLVTNATFQLTTKKTEVTLNLTGSFPYSWYIVSKSSKTSVTAQSDVWKFYNAFANSVGGYVPYPADLTAPKFGQKFSNTTIVDLRWTGSVYQYGKPIVDYDVYLGTTTAPVLLKKGVKDSVLLNVNVMPNTTYYWEVVTNNLDGYSSHSELYQFVVN
ncbi:MAG TPA: hypothetical protein VK668_16975 [Mucilaginibacter sp.]|nr:hypothetical protein [Mucilaginibacter sp.]